MRSGLTSFLAGLIVLAAGQLASAQNGNLRVPKTVEAGAPFSIQTSGSGKGVLYIVGPGQVLRRDVQLGEAVSFVSGDMHNAGHYLVVLTGGSSPENGAFDVTAAHQPTTLSFIAKPSRIPVDLHDGISGVVYVFDTFHNLVFQPTPVSFQLSGVAGAPQNRTVTSKNGVAWTKLDSASKEGAAKFEARAGNVADERIIQQVPGDPCKLKMDVRPAGQRLQLETEPVRDCSGNAVPDGTIITFTEIYDGGEATVDVPLKRGVAKTEMPAYKGATISVATGVVMGNEIRWGKE
jgi:hypothetical protein